MTDKQTLIEINKMIGETGHLRDEATLEHICLNSKNVAYDIATKHPFVNGNKRTAYIALKVLNNYTSLTVLESTDWALAIVNSKIEDNKEWLDILKDC